MKVWQLNIKIGNYIRERYLPRSSAPPCEKNSLERTHPETYVVEIRLTSNTFNIEFNENIMFLEHRNRQAHPRRIMKQ